MSREDFDLLGSKITNSGAPVNDNDLATVKYVKDNAGSTPVRETMYDETQPGNNNQTIRFNIIPTGINKDFKNIQTTLITPNTSNNILTYINNLIDIDSNTTYYTIQQDETNLSNFVRLAMNPRRSQITVLNKSNVNGDFRLKLTGERITPIVKKK